MVPQSKLESPLRIYIEEAGVMKGQVNAWGGKIARGRDLSGGYSKLDSIHMSEIIDITDAV